MAEPALPHEGVMVRLAPSEIHGVGVFAAIPIKAGTSVFATDQREINWVSQARVDDSKPGEFERSLYEDFAIRRGDEFGCPANFNLLTVGWYVNEPPEGEPPNLRGNEKFDLVAARDIDAGEELTLRYSTLNRE